ncbi:MAG TPA: arginine--tRNA ligase [Planctomycetota bacterium]|nr:arginine--tRNA ligase [Planctomycetota bacterium]HRR79748.1 arginine--tRNA ligase [Planctomycetota bacterium]HRT96307.1 arginine--tRNA ligase [Planctomycetota bacterium]
MLERALVTGFQAALAEAAARAFGDVDLGGLAVQFAPTPSPDVGDLGFGCFPLAKVLRRKPHDVAATLAETIQLPPLFRKTQAVGPYLNLFLDRGAFLGALCREIAAAGQAYGNAEAPSGQTIALEFSSPNTNKPQHLGHVRNNVLGMALARILEAAGHRVLKLNLINDRGVHICQSMLAYQRWGNGATPQSTGRKGDHFVGDYYVRFAREAEKDPSLKDQAQDLLRRWEQGDPQVVALWRTMNGWVYEGFDATYRRLGVEFDRIYHESETYRHGRDIVLKALAEGRCYRLPDGAVEADLEADGLDKKILLRRDGTTVYITQDLGTAVARHGELGFDRMYYVVASEQIHHFRVLFALLRRFGYEWAANCRHVSYGMVYLPEGKMKSREGKVVDADDLMDEVEALAAEAVREKHADIAPADLARRGTQIALGAIKFYLLAVNLEKDITFDPAASVSFEGDTGPYVQYSHTRICGILRKAEATVGGASLPREADFAALGNNAETALGLLLMQFPAAVRDAAESCNPQRVASHVLEVARSFAQFYHDSPVLQAESPGLIAARLELCRATQTVLRRGLGLLGIEAPEQM